MIVILVLQFYGHYFSLICEIFAKHYEMASGCKKYAVESKETGVNERNGI